MDKTSYCGVDCQTCPVFLAEKARDPQAKETLARAWGKLYNRTFSPEEMACGGCRSERRFGMCRGCDIVACNLEKGTAHCGLYPVFPCERIEKLYRYQKEKETGVSLHPFAERAAFGRPKAE